MTGKTLRDKRRQADVTGDVICQRTGISRSRLSAIERGCVEPNSSEARRIERAITELVRAKKQVAEVAAQVGWPM